MYRRPSAALFCAIAIACGGESGPNGAEVGSIRVTPNPLALAQQATRQLEVEVFDDAGAELTGAAVTFTSANTNLVTVTGTGLVSSVGPAGTSSVTVRSGDVAVQVPVTVSATGNGVRIQPSPATVDQLQSLQLEVELLDLAGAVIPGVTFAFASSSAGIATVDPTGLVQSTGPSGSVTITATTVGLSGGNLSAQVQVTVAAVPTSLELLPDPILIGKNSSIRLEARVLDAVGAPMPGEPIAFSASPASHLAVTAEGRLSGLGLPGTGTVTATSGAFEVSVPVTLNDAGSLAGTMISRATTTPSPFGVALGPSGEVFGTTIGGRLDVGAFGSTDLESHSVSGEITIGIAVHPTSGMLYVAGLGPDALMEIDPATGGVLRRWGLEGGQMFDVVVSPDGQLLYVGGNSARVYAISIATMEKVAEFFTGMDVVHLAADPTRPRVFASGGGAVREIDVETGSQRTFAIPSAQASSLALSGNRLFVGKESGQLGVVTLSTGVVEFESVPECGIYDVAAAPDGLKVLVTCAENGAAKLIDAETLEVLTTISTGGFPRRIAISEDGTKAVIANEGGWYDHIE